MDEKKENIEQSCFTCIHHVSGEASCRYSPGIEKHHNPKGSSCLFYKANRQQYKRMAINRDEAAIEQIIFDSD